MTYDQTYLLKRSNEEGNSNVTQDILRGIWVELKSFAVYVETHLFTSSLRFVTQLKYLYELHDISSEFLRVLLHLAVKLRVFKFSYFSPSHPSYQACSWC